MKPTHQINNHTHILTAYSEQVNNTLETQLENVRKTAQYADTSLLKPLQLALIKVLNTRLTYQNRMNITTAPQKTSYTYSLVITPLAGCNI